MKFIETNLAVKTAAAATMAVSLSLMSGVSAQAADYVMKFAVSAANDTDENYALACERAVEEATNGAVDVQVFNRGQLGSQRAVIEGLQTGTVEAVITPADFFAGVDARMGVFSFPFLFKDRSHANRVLGGNEDLRNYIMDITAPKNIVGIAIFAQADGRYMAKDPIHSLSDFDGKKLRINGTDAERERFARLGATAVAMNLPDMIQALTTGVIDGSMSGQTIWTNFNLDSVSKELLIVEDTLLVSYAGVSKPWLDTLPDGMADTVVNACRGLFDTAVELADDFNYTLTGQWVLDKGGIYNRLSAEDMATMREKLATVGEAVTEGKPELREFYERIKSVSDSTE